uniref:GIY-YIG endonuclease n=1 Tax=Chrysoporthe austroafricana TaxID=354353 RepID=A0A191MWZ7_9PEZI|nr:GIY-YIG endonuclease [Chrysoporthe austroafricana]AMX22129.1 GIY-YIG endonuclease [Chrysoporthe austroafricana]
MSSLFTIKINKNMKNKKNLLKKINWYGIDKKGFLKKPLNYKGAGIYIYMRCLSKDDVSFYVGSSFNLNNRVISHRFLAINWNKENYQKIGSPIFYRSVLKDGWEKFKFGVLEYLDFSNITDKKIIKIKLLEREQYYLDSINPSLNICKIASSPLGVKRADIFRINLSKDRKGKKKNKYTTNIKTRIITNEARLKISLRNKGISVKVFDKLGNLINEFSTITSAANYFGVTHKTISNIYKTPLVYPMMI